MSEQQDELDRLTGDSSTFPSGPGDTLVTIGIFPDPSQANLASAALDAAGIPSFLQGENANSLIPVAFLARLQVRAIDEIAARGILEIPSEEADVTAAERLSESPEFRPL